MASKSLNQVEDRVWEVIGNAGICMMVTRFTGGLRARPLEAHPNREQDAIFFLTDVRGLKDDEIEREPEICLTFIDPAEKVYLSLSGEAVVTRDIQRAKSLWTEKERVWWPGGPEDPNLRVIRVEPRRAEMWDGPASSAVAAHEFAKARATGDKPNLGEKRKVSADLG